MSSTTYDEQFYSGRAAGSRTSAARILPLIMQVLEPRSVIDIGCGTGSWLAECSARGVSDLLGIDGDYVSETQLEIPSGLFEPRDLRLPLRVERRFDLALSLEVAEHLPPERAESLVTELVALAPAVLFSAAVPGQGGQDHLNERWQDYWLGLFSAAGYAAADVVRSAVWDDPAVEPWYAQNTLLYVAPELGLPAQLAMPARVVHPRLFATRAAYEPSLGEIARAVTPSVRRSARHHLQRLVAPDGPGRDSRSRSPT